MGAGTTFEILLPRVMSQAEPPPQPQAPELSPGWARILVVEDDEGVRHVAITMLRRLGYTVYGAASATIALGFMARPPAPIDLILTDVVMPQMSGREFVQALREMHVQTPILYMSGYAEEALDSQGVLEAGAPLVRKAVRSRAVVAPGGRSATAPRVTAGRGTHPVRLLLDKNARPRYHDSPRSVRRIAARFCGQAAPPPGLSNGVASKRRCHRRGV